MKIAESHRYVVEQNGKVLSRGYARVPVDPTEPVSVFRIWTRKDSRRQGHGKTLMLEIIREWGHRKMKLVVGPEKTSGLTKDDLYAFYSQFGFARKGETQTMIRTANGDKLTVNEQIFLKLPELFQGI